MYVCVRACVHASVRAYVSACMHMCVRAFELKIGIPHQEQFHVIMYCIVYTNKNIDILSW